MPNDTARVASAMEDDARTIPELLAAYRGGTDLLADAIEGMSAGQLRARSVEGKMSSLEVVAHVCDCEQFLADRMKRIIALDTPLLVGVNGSLYLDALGYQDRDPQLDIAMARATREQMAADLERLGVDAWSRTGVHTEVGVVTLRQQLLHTIRHLEWHLETIAEKRCALGL
ncbi:MAG: DinB family protein [Coriobacteriia bacterium]|nr:DinB family protein [Coriobacteriia bacterium]MBN2823448.1 DinB family protein [Coriobacteriia bacterium]